MSSTAPIGVFDSGLGGLSVVRQIRHGLPHERILYYGDSANAPYGTRPPEEVRSLALGVARRLVDQGAKAMVVACNTATSVAIDHLRDVFDIPIIGMEPALKVACDQGHGSSQKVIVAATPLTLRESKFAALMKRFSRTNIILRQPCPDLVRIVEEGQLDDHELVDTTLHQYFDAYNLDTVDSVVLGCTHFVFFRNDFRRLLPRTTAIIDGNKGTAHHLSVVLESLGLMAPENQRGGTQVSNSNPSPALKRLSQDLLERPL
ncbi:glutamate racemase [uncultured Bifidobacterium sp.]|uniref:glutamate racemase n=1 Tax=uncultured Bifidobacterium sp. TaxID=165187 RepID=UPI00260AD803|nr:glutamate racemase [uncultured Bifidobacterium sp.]